MTEAPAGVLRLHVRESAAVLPVELFFDLVYVLAITQLIALGALVPLAAAASALVLIVAATSVLVGIVVWDLVIERRRLLAEAESQLLAAEVQA